MKHKKLKLSLVIPVFNEQDYLENCLDSIAAQSVRPYQVIVVDNNSTDNTMRIAESYDFVTILTEKRQSQVFAQKTGFDYADGDIIGRIDADAILPKNWARNVIAAFTSNPNAVAISGYGEPYDVPFKTIGVKVMRTYLYTAGAIAGHRMIWGSNCAISAKGWAKVSKSVLQRPDVWEDYDLAFKLSWYGEIVPIGNITVKFSGRSAHRPLAQQYSYQFRSLRTFFLNTSLLRTLLYTVVAHSMIILFPLAALDSFISNRRRSQHIARAKLRFAWLAGINRNN